MNDEQSDLRSAIRAAALDPPMVALRASLAAFTGEVFQAVGEQLHVVGHILGPDRKNGKSPGGHGDDRVVAVSMLLRIGSQLVAGSAELIGSGRHYAGMAQLMLSDCLGHAGRIWNHLVRWETGRTSPGFIAARRVEMLDRYSEWKQLDTLTALPPLP